MEHFGSALTAETILKLEWREVDRAAKSAMSVLDPMEEGGGKLTCSAY